MRDEFARQMKETVDPLKEELERLKKEAADAREQATNERFRGDFARVAEVPEFRSLRVEYDDDVLFRFADGLRRDPARMVSTARHLKVALTGRDGGFNMMDIFRVLKAQQDQHEQSKQQRAARFQAAPSSPQAPQASSAKPTVNGTAEKRNAGTVLGNALVSETATGEEPRLSRRDRVRKMIEETGR